MQNRAPGCKQGVESLVREGRGAGCTHTASLLAQSRASARAQHKLGAAIKSHQTKPSMTAHKN